MNNTNKTYPKWAGVLLGCLLPGSAHFLSGNRVTGIRWYLVLFLMPILGLLILSIPGVGAFYLSILTLLFAVVLLIIMLKQSFRPVRRIGILGWITVIVLNGVLNLVLRSGMEIIIKHAVNKQVVRLVKVPSGGMSPTIIPGDRLIVEGMSYRFRKPKRGEIVLLSTRDIDYPNVRTDTYFVRRIVGLPGETIQIDPPNLIVNGEAVKGSAVFTALSSDPIGFTLSIGSIPSLLSTSDDKIVLEENEYLVLGDKFNSLDGRHHGPISAESIVGRVSRICWPLSRIGK